MAGIQWCSGLASRLVKPWRFIKSSIVVFMEKSSTPLGVGAIKRPPPGVDSDSIGYALVSTKRSSVIERKGKDKVFLHRFFGGRSDGWNEQQLAEF